LIIKKKNGVEDFIFDPRPFYIAFKNGYWLLLDELNLAQDVVGRSTLEPAPPNLTNGGFWEFGGSHRLNLGEGTKPLAR